ncbi:MAG: transcriptional repressor [Deltaproteobacteria bacterium]|nr:transcriptional repressor [Deltaproteobacteria bacterium]
MQNISSNPRLEEIILKIKKVGYSLTPQRYEIVKILSESKNHPTAADIYNKVKMVYPMVSLNTIYKNLTMLTSMREVKEIKTLQNAVHFDGDISSHGHVICENCGKITDIGINADDFNGFLKSDINNNAFNENYHIRGYSIEFYGLCRDCYEADKN